MGEVGLVVAVVVTGMAALRSGTALWDTWRGGNHGVPVFRSACGIFGTEAHARFCFLVALSCFDRYVLSLSGVLSRTFRLGGMLNSKIKKAF